MMSAIGLSTLTLACTSQTPPATTPVSAAPTSTRTPQEVLRIIPLGGVREIGKSCTIIETAKDMIIIDCGVKLPDANTPGVDLVIPEFGYVLEHADKLRGLVFTHGHEDHIGATAYFLDQLNPEIPIFGTKFTLGLTEQVLKDHGVSHLAQFHPMNAGESTRLGGITVEFCRVTHSVPDSACIILQTPVGTVVHSGDFKFDPDPEDGLVSDKARLERAGDRGVIALLCEGTRVERQSPTVSEKEVGAVINSVVARAEGRVFFSTFASNISRLRQAVRAAQNNGRKVAVFGTAMRQNLELAERLGYYRMPDSVRADPDALERVPDNEILYLVTGTQAEPAAVLNRLANGSHKDLQIRSGDTVVLSNSVVPGNEQVVARMIDSLYRRGARVLYNDIHPGLHVSGHGGSPDIAEMVTLCRPQFFIPIHADYRHQYHLREIAVNNGVAERNILIPSIGDLVEVSQLQMVRRGQVQSGSVMIDGLTVGQVTDRVLDERSQLAEDGLITVTVALDTKSARILDGPQVFEYGFADVGRNDLLDELRRFAFYVLKDMYGKPVTRGLVIDRMREAVGDFVWTKYELRPVVLVFVNLL